MSEAKPTWARIERMAMTLTDVADDLSHKAEGLRCPVRTGLGARCTRDAHPAEHEHRVDVEDLP